MRRTLALAVAAATMLAVTTQLPASSATAARPVVYLTFDDGPSTDTRAVLDILARYGVKATFFEVGNAVAGRASIARRVVAGGHRIGNHTWSHPSLTKLSSAGVRSEITRTQDAISAATGRRPGCVRPPYGATNATVRTVLGSMGLTQALWNVDTRDWSGISVSAIVASMNTARHGSVILLHDGGGKRGRTVEALRTWLAANHSRFEFRTLPGC
jgi:peptidoglycan/xylan/chitin deacetylase (PgdA/CDA1 family)